MKRTDSAVQRYPLAHETKFISLPPNTHIHTYFCTHARTHTHTSTQTRIGRHTGTQAPWPTPTPIPTYHAYSLRASPLWAKRKRTSCARDSSIDRAGATLRQRRTIHTHAHTSTHTYTPAHTHTGTQPRSRPPTHMHPPTPRHSHTHTPTHSLRASPLLARPKRTSCGRDSSIDSAGATLRQRRAIHTHAYTSTHTYTLAHRHKGTQARTPTHPHNTHKCTHPPTDPHTQIHTHTHIHPPPTYTYRASPLWARPKRTSCARDFSRGRGRGTPRQRRSGLRRHRRPRLPPPRRRRRRTLLVRIYISLSLRMDVLLAQAALAHP